MKIFRILPIGLCLLTLTLLTNCAKDGATGPAGPTGAAGTPGKDGNANVKTSTLFITGSEWTINNGEATITKLMPEITADLVNKGAVMVYTKPSSASGPWDALPTTFASPTGEVLSFGYSIEPGKLNLYITWDFQGVLTAAAIGNNDFRVAQISGAARTQNPNLDMTDYNQVEKLATE